MRADGAADIVAIEVFNTARGHGPLNRMRVRRLAAVLGVCGVVAGCSTTMSGTARPADPAGPTSATTTAPTPALVPAAGVRAKLLNRDELAGILGDTDMKDTGDYTKPDEALLLKFDPDGCAPRLIVGVGEGYFKQAAFVENVNKGARGQVADQAISVWQNRNQATSQVRETAVDWGLCRDNQVITVKIPDAPEHWVSGAIASRAPTSRISTTSQRQEPPQRTCSHVMAAQGNVVVETSVSGDGDTLAAANEIADRILAKLPQ